MIHDVNNSLPPVVEWGMDHEGLSHAGCGGGAEEDKEEILCFVRGGVAGGCWAVSFGFCLARVRVEGFLLRLGFLAGLGVLSAW